MIIYKGYQVKPDEKAPGCLKIVTDGKGGKIPDCLGGLYTNTTLAIRDIDNYLELRASKVKNAKTEVEE